MSEVSLTIRGLREELDLTLAQLAERVGINSVGHMSDIERGAPCSVSVALKIEELSKGRIAASTLSKDVALVEAARSRDHVAGDTSEDQAGSSGKIGEISGEQVAA